MTLARLAAAAAAALAIVPAAASAATPEQVASLRLPDGFKAELFAEVPGAREMAVMDDGRTIFVSTRGETVWRLDDVDGDGRPDARTAVITDGKMPHGIDIGPDGRLYVVETHRVRRFALSETWPREPGPGEMLHEGLIDRRHHGWRAAEFGPDGLLYAAVGAPCNICAVEGLAATLVRFDPRTWEPETIARGVRNSVGFDWHPETGVLHFTDNGGDNMGDHIPPDELNRLDAPGQHFGFPFVWGKAEKPYPQFADATPPEGTVTPLAEIEAHAGALGMVFYTGAMFPEEYRNDAFIALQGSWNRDPMDPSGYQLLRARFSADGGFERLEIFADGFLAGQSSRTAWGKPAQLALLPDGSLLIGDDYAGAIYRIFHEN
ncbi:PQQ-dependent sugar dehydrogenase [Futiania mangrovi]|uniref:PQQ-dependent sugar dehydrogenase n=1 Tax=Futiania mangrovi TaxID=2959716 RepID=A0A9J6PIM8_9PROT|nr:PQQ-dependent sugar dehydrogenase [Futiania mangrovii]MCP1337664.1 PQQ-dependent sugar dehydrogenase [Futiania mangrovii]